MTDENPKEPSGPPSLLDKSEEDLYEMALTELGSDSKRQGLWAKVLSESLGDESKSAALYIRYRVEQLSEELSKERIAQAPAKCRELIASKCPKCSTTILVEAARISKAGFFAARPYHRCTHCNKLFDLRTLYPKELRRRLQKPFTARIAVVSLTCGIIGGWASTASIPAVICGHIALKNIKKEPEAYGGKRMAVAGLILGYIGLVLAVALGTIRGVLRAQLEQMGF
jgi:transposase-like protein